MNEDTELIDNDLGVIVNVKPSMSIEAQREVKEENFNNTNLLLG